MKPIAFAGALILLLASCGGSDEQKQAKSSDNDIDAARNFLEAALKGKYRQASGFMLQDSTNLGYLAVTEASYKNLDPVRRDSLKSSSLRFYDTRQLNDSTTITIFSNSYKNDKDTLRIVKSNGHWLVDLKYLFEHDMDTLNFNQKNKIDSINK